MSPSIVVLDGGFSSQLSKHVGERVDGDPLWTARFLRSNPTAVLQTHVDFLEAGAQAIMTNTYQASVGGFKKFLNITEREAYDLIKSAVELAKKARETFLQSHPDSEDTPLIVGSVGPYGAHLHDGSEYSGNYADFTSKQTMIEWHKPRIEALIESGVDLLAFETIPCQKEAEAMLELLKSYPATKAWMSFSVKDSNYLAHGEEFKSVLTECWDSPTQCQLVAMGVNCCNPFWICDLFKGINDSRKDNPIPFVVYPNSGEKYKPELDSWVDEGDCKTLDTFVDSWLDLGVRFVGGCCRTYAEDIKRIRSKVQEWKEK